MTARVHGPVESSRAAQPWRIQAVLSRLGVAAAAAVVLGLVTWSVLEPGQDNWLTSLDIRARAQFIGVGDTPVRRLAHKVVMIGDVRIVVPATLALIIGVALVRRQWRPVVVAGGAVAALGLSVTGFKDMVGRLGPGESMLPLVHAGGSAYPSGHTATVVVCLGLVAMQLRDVFPRLRAWPMVVVAAVTVVVGTAFVYGPGHWVSDVIGGIALGALILAIAPWPLSSGGEDRRR